MTPTIRFSHFDSHDMPSDSDDDAGFEMEYDNIIDITGSIFPSGLNSTNSNTPSNVYCTNTQFRLPFGGPSRPSQFQRKLDKVVNHRVKCQTSAQRASTTIPKTMVSLVQAIAQAFDSSLEARLFTSDDPEEACADSGTTDVMIPDFNTFISYRPCTNRFAILGNETSLPILREGTEKFSLNGKILLICNRLHIPDLRSPL